MLFRSIIWWSQTARTPLTFLTPEQQAVINQCDYLKAIQLYSIQSDFNEYRYPYRLRRQFGRGCESGCVCESEPIENENQFIFELTSDDETDISDDDTLDYIPSDDFVITNNIYDDIFPQPNFDDDVDDVVGALPQLQLEDNQVVDHESDSESGYESDGLIIQQ